MTQYLPNKFITKQFTIDAIKYSKANCGNVHSWINQPHLLADDEGYNLCGSPIYLSDHDIVEEGDWICRDHDGFYAVPADLFENNFVALHRRRFFRRWVVTALASRQGGPIVNMAPVSRHYTLRSANKAIAKYITWENPNPNLIVNYQIDPAARTHVSYY